MLKDRNRPPSQISHIRVISKALCASEAMRKVPNPKTGRNYTKADADKWVWRKLSPADRDLFNRKARGDHDPTFKLIEHWRRQLRRQVRFEGRDKGIEIMQGWLDTDCEVRRLRILDTPPSAGFSWQQTAEQIISGKFRWPPPAPGPPTNWGLSPAAAMALRNSLSSNSSRP